MTALNPNVHKLGPRVLGNKQLITTKQLNIYMKSVMLGSFLSSPLLSLKIINQQHLNEISGPHDDSPKHDKCPPHQRR